VPPIGHMMASSEVRRISQMGIILAEGSRG
jgi:hypothetical protein